ncbi:PP2C family protein-serine/threonine phosphatase [Desulfobacula phenolica]|uniref:Serine/threonine protein phosphatase PrpC n=1 Tax=Desulfobacula phenolica TaxID=90732 RepID=A0A1H2ID13_9BACT|nr:protein phosphatase 2C domain-containing protein [Desulfobacula phenolica]SDU42017.1 Serine/threonine protein phosphatase PrpC [Desulfobacula phenolica]
MKEKNKIKREHFYTYLKNWLGQSVSCGENSITIHNKSISLKTTIGNNRPKNQDRAAFVIITNHFTNKKNLAISILADGMGGMVSGEEAASSAIASFIAYLSLNVHNSGLKDICRRAIEHANVTVNKLLNDKGGSTLSAIVYSENGCVGVNVGDSRIYYFDQNNGLTQVSKDDTILGQLDNNSSENWEDPTKGDNRLAQFIGTSDELIPHIIDLTEYSKKITDSFFILTTDGTHYIGNNMMERIIKVSDKYNTVANKIINIAEWLSGHDNSTLVICPNKITVNRLKTDQNSEELEQITIYDFDRETNYLVPIEFENFYKENAIIRSDDEKKMQYKSEALFLNHQSKIEKEKFSKTQKKVKKKPKKDDKNDLIVDLLPPEKKG